MKNKIIIMALLANGHLIQAQGIHVTSTGLTGFNTTLPPANRVEIKSGQGDPFFNNNPNTASSGLRFTNLNNTHTPFNITTNNKILSVDANGDVILVQDQLGTPTSGISVAQNGLSALGLTTVELGRLQNAASPAQLLNHREIPMGGNNILFSETPQNPMPQYARRWTQWLHRPAGGLANRWCRR